LAGSRLDQWKEVAVADASENDAFVISWIEMCLDRIHMQHRPPKAPEASLFKKL